MDDDGDGDAGPGPGPLSMQRVKVYRLNKETGIWDDKGTGSVSVEFLEVRVGERNAGRGGWTRRQRARRGGMWGACGDLSATVASNRAHG